MITPLRMYHINQQQLWKGGLKYHSINIDYGNNKNVTQNPLIISDRRIRTVCNFWSSYMR